MDRKREVPAVVAPIRSWFRRLGRRSSPFCISAFAFGLAPFTGLMASPPPPPPAAAPASAQQTAPAAAVEAPKPAASEPAKSEPAAASKPAGPETQAVAQPDKPASHHDPSPAPAPAPPATTASSTPPPSPAPPPMSNLEKLRKAADLMAEVNTAVGAPRSPYGQLIYDIAVRHSVNPHLVAAMIHVESAFNPRAVSRKGACGLMQLLPETARRFGVKKKKDLFDPSKNLEAGVKYLKWLTKRFGGDTQKILAAYNAGEGAVERFGGIPPYRETQSYVKKIFGLLGINVAPGVPAAVPSRVAPSDEVVPAGR